MAQAPALKIEQLTSRRNKTETASKLLDAQLKSYLEMIKPATASHTSNQKALTIASPVAGC